MSVDARIAACGITAMCLVACSGADSGSLKRSGGARSDGGAADGAIPWRADAAPRPPGDAAPAPDRAAPPPPVTRDARADSAGEPLREGGGAEASPSDPAPDASAGPEGGDGGDAADACAARRAWYADLDDDGYGVTASALVACAKPGPHYAERDGDCDDEDSRAHPGQTAYYGEPWKRAGGEPSFDFDCSGTEEGDPSEARAPAACGLLSLTLCAGSGYFHTSRTGIGIDPFCGSKVTTTCQAALAVLVCQSVAEAVEEPYRCR